MFDETDVKRNFMQQPEVEEDIHSIYLHRFPKEYRRKLKLIAIELGQHDPTNKKFAMSLWVRTACKFFIEECERREII